MASNQCDSNLQNLNDFCSDSGRHFVKLYQSKAFGGYWYHFKHDSTTTRTPMEFSVYLPPSACQSDSQASRPVKSVWWLGGHTCTPQTFVQKSGAARAASELNLALVVPDTSPRTPVESRLHGEEQTWDFGLGAGYYVNAVTEPWLKHYQMYSYVTKELPELLAAEQFPLAQGEKSTSILGHGMGGHGALICGLKTPGKYASVSAFAPICNPSCSPWGVKAFSKLLGNERKRWREYDATELVQKYEGPPMEILISQGTEDKFLQDQLLPHAFQAAASRNPSQVRLQMKFESGYDHSYQFITTFLESHLRFHHSHLY